jgi:hypothetical protein
VCQRYQDLEERKRALALADHVAAVVTGRAVLNNVVSLTARSRFLPAAPNQSISPGVSLNGAMEALQCARPLH